MFRLKSFLGSICISLLFVGLYFSSAFSATLWVDDDGTLKGAYDVEVNGKYYDVEFVDGSAEQIFSDGEGRYTMAFFNQNRAVWFASRALCNQILNQVNPKTNKLIRPMDIRGIKKSPMAKIYIIYGLHRYGNRLPRLLNADVMKIEYSGLGKSDDRGWNAMSVKYATGSQWSKEHDDEVFSKWTLKPRPSQTPVP